ncbi:MAG: DUF2029 domain-containing protein [Candidatus Eremiobacteraeota bacterium]|nr:DUF2029 domain-containing protein [Candidatus Eremiobacteraeota bacterium]
MIELVRRWAPAIAIVLLALAAARDFARLGDAMPGKTMIDFSVFYCAGSVALQKGDPYATGGPLRACEHGINHGGAWNDPNHEMPAPQPPYDLAFFEALARLPYGVAKAAFALAIVAAVVVTALALADLGVPFVAALAALALSDGFVGVANGQIYPFAVMLVALAAAALRAKRDVLAAACIGLTLLVPQIGVPVVLVAAIFVPRTRVPIAVTIAALGIAGTVALGPHAWTQWTTALPLATRVETGFAGQYSLTSVLTAVGVPPGAALAAGALSSLLVLVLASYASRRLAREHDRPEFYALVPAAFAPIGGSYVHLAAIAASVGLALVLCAGSQPRARFGWVLPAIVILLSVPWLLTQAHKPLFFSALLVAACILVQFNVPARAGVAMAAVTALVLWALAVRTPPPITGLEQFDATRELAKLPTWLGLFGLLAATLRSANDEHALVQVDTRGRAGAELAAQDRGR